MAQERDPKLDQCDKEIADILAKYGKTIRPVPFITADGRVEAQVVYFDVEKKEEALPISAETQLAA